ncbi:MAG: hypothetical protein WEF50_00440 [Myxococcota bacterium]
MARWLDVARSLRLAVVLALVLAVGGRAGVAAAELVELTVDSGASSVGATLAISYLGASDSDTVAHMPFAGVVQADVGLGSDPVHGVVPVSLQFLSGDVSSSGAQFALQLVSSFVIDISVTLASLLGRFDPELMPADPPSAAGTASVDLAPIDLVFDSGTLAMVVEPPGGEPIVMDFAESPLVFALGGSGTVVLTPGTGGLDVTVTIPVDEIALTSEGGIDVELTLFGDLVLRGTIAPQVPALSPLATLGLVLLSSVAIVVGGSRALAAR